MTRKEVKMKFTDVCIFTERVNEMIKFYEQIFDAKAEGDDIHSVLKTKDLTIAFYDKSNAESLMGFDFSDSGNGMTYIGFNVENVDDEYTRLKELGITSISEPKLWAWGAKSFNFKDIDGNRIMFRTWFDE